MSDRSKTVKTTPIPVRLDEHTQRRLASAARRMSSNRSAVIRFAVNQTLPEIESGRLLLPRDVQ